MSTRDYTATMRVDRSPREVFDAINDVRGWWSGEIEGRTDKLGAEFTYRYQNFHTSKQRIAELVPGRKVAWLVLESSLNFIADKDEWNGTRIEFDIARKGDKTEIRFTHVGLVPEQECFGACSNAWSYLFTESLKKLITTGQRAGNSDLNSER